MLLLLLLPVLQLLLPLLFNSPLIAP